MPIDIFDPNFPLSNFPGPSGISDPQIDQFVNLIDSVTATQVRDDQKVYAQFYNKLRNAVESCQRYVVMTSASACIASGSGYDGDGSVSNLGKVYEHSISLQKFVGFAHNNHQLSLSGNTLPFEFVIVPNTNHSYQNIPNPSSVLIVNEGLYSILKTQKYCMTVNLRTMNDGGTLASGVASGATYPYGYALALSCSSHIVHGGDMISVRGLIIDHVDEPAGTDWYANSAGLMISLAVISL